MSLLMGPVLSFRGCDDNKWNLTALVVSKDDDPPALTVGGKTVKAEVLWEHALGKAHRYTLAFPMAAKATTVTYSVDGQSYDVTVPAAGQAPRMAYASCNGFSSSKLMKGVKYPNSLWNTMADKHGLPPLPSAIQEKKDREKDKNTMPEVKEPSPYHLLLLGGDQVYADAMWETQKPMKDWLHLSWDKGNKAHVTETMRKALDTFYFDLYCSRWSQPEVQQMLARVPNIAMWDDHDFMDGWGSYPPERQDCEVFDAIWTAASKAFSIFQQQLKDGERRPGFIGKADANWWQQPDKQETRKGAFSFAYTIGNVAILAIDMRSQRTSETQVVSQTHWDEIYKWIDDELPEKKVEHLLVMSSIPVIYPGFDVVETVLGIFPGHQDLEDDLRDHWNSQPHKGERVRMVHNLLAVPSKKGVRTTILSGDVHVAALGVVQSSRDPQPEVDTTINQLISSGVVHPGPGAVVLFALHHLFDSTDEIDRDIVGRMVQFSGSQAKFLGGRNYLSLEPDDKSNIWCNWLVEKQRFPFTKVIHPVLDKSQV
jgi:hypothetical protein